MHPYRQNAYVSTPLPRIPLFTKMRSFLAIVTLSVGALFAASGCSVLFPGLQTGTTVADLDAFIQVASNVSSWAADAWSVLPASAQTSAAADYDAAQNALKSAIALAEDAVATYQAGTGSPPDWATLITAVDNGVDTLVAEIASLAGLSADTLPGSSKVALMSGTFATRLAQLRSAQVTAHRYHATP